MDSNLLKEAIADAKAVRQTALANAKVALEEAFSERYSAMFAEKLKEDAEAGGTNGTDKTVAAVKSEENVGEQEIDELIRELESQVGDEPTSEEPPLAGAESGAEMTPPPVDGAVPPAMPTATPGMCPPGFIPLSAAIAGGYVPPAGGAGGAAGAPPVDGAVPPAPVTPPGAEAGAGMTPPPSDVPPTGQEDEEINLDELLESLKKEVEGEKEEDECMNEDTKLDSSKIAPGNNKKPAAGASSSSHIESGGLTDNGVPESKMIAKDPTEVTKKKENFGANKDGNLATTPSVKEGIALKDKGIPGGKETSNGDDATEVTKSEENFNGNKDGNLATTPSIKEENTKLKKQLNEAIETIKYVKGQLNEINLLNAKLLYTNKLFKEYNINNEQKMRIVEMFDLAKNVRDVKMTYANFAEALNFGGVDTKRKLQTNSTVQSITEGLASKPVGSTKPSKGIISEGKSSEMVTKFQKLAGIKKS